MGYSNRDYSRGGGGDGLSLVGVGRWIVGGRVPLFRAFGIDVQAHSTLLIAMVLTLLFLGSGFQWQDRVIAAALLFVIVLLHEFGHCFGARSVGGDADEIVMHPLGGLALTRPPSDWKAHFITTACGPLVNVAICVVCGGLLFALTGRVPWQPIYLHPWTYFRGWLDPVWLLFWIYQTSWALLLFNLLPIYPLDGGRMVQELLWPRVGYYRSMLYAATTGLVACVLVGMAAIAIGAIGLLVLAVLGGMTCVSMRRQLHEFGPHAFGDYDDPFSAAMRQSQRDNRNANRRKTRGPTWAERRRARAAAAERERAVASEAEIDRILAKVSASGMHSLTRGEQRTLREATARQQRATTAATKPARSAR